MVLATCLLAACGGGGGDDPAPAADPTPDPTPQPTPPADPPPPQAGEVPPLAAPPESIDDEHRVGVSHWPAGNTSTGGQGQTVAGKYDCGVMDETYHVHTHLAVILNGERLAIPWRIGIVVESPGNQCYYAIHTHDASGKVHVEGPAPGTFTLGDFFAIWGQPLARDNVAGLTGMPVVVYIVDDGVATKYEDDIAAIELTSQRQITIQVGTDIAEIPTYSWTGT
jgi:hypothetical protein